MHRWLRLIVAPFAAWGVLALSLFLPLAACSPDYPMDKRGTWNVPPGDLNANDANLRAMVVDPRDLTAGASAEGSEGYAAARPVGKLLSGQRPALPSTSGTPLEATGGQVSATPSTAGSNGSSLEQ